MSVGFGFLGAGGIARGALRPAVDAADGAHLQAVASRDAARAVALEPAGTVYDDYAGLLEDPSVDVVYVALHNDVHEQWATAALRAGKHVLCEKPLGLDAAQVARMQQAAQDADRLLVEAWWYRWHPRTVRAVDLVASGDLGPVRHMEAAFCFDGDFDGEQAGNYRMDPALGGGAIYDVGCYTAEAARWALAGAPLTLTSAAGRFVGPPEAPVDVAAQVRASAALPDGSKALVDLRCAIRGEIDQLVAVHGAAASVVLGGESFASHSSPSSLYVIPTDRRRVDPVREDFPAVDPYRLMVEAVAARVQGDDAWLPDLTDSLAVARFTDAWRAGARDGV